MVFGSGTKFRIRRSASKASYAAQRRERERALEGSYKRTASPSDTLRPAAAPAPDRHPHQSESGEDAVSLTDSCGVAGGAFLQDERAPFALLRPRSATASSSASSSLGVGGSGSGSGSVCGSCCSDQSAGSPGPERAGALHRLDLLPVASNGNGKAHPAPPPPAPLQQRRKEPSPDVVVPALAAAGAGAGAVDSGAQCDLGGEGRTSPPPPSPPTPTLTASVASALVDARPKAAAAGARQGLQLVQRSEVVVRVGAATSDAASQTDAHEAPRQPSGEEQQQQQQQQRGEGEEEEGKKEEKEEEEEVEEEEQEVAREEAECQRLSLALASQLPPAHARRLHTLLVPDPEHKKPTDYVSGLFRIDVALRPRPALAPSLRNSPASNSSSPSADDQAANEEKKEDTSTSSVSPLPANSKYFTISESKAKFLNRYVRDIGQLNGVHDNKDLHQKKEELVSRLDRKLEVLREERLLVGEESRVNEELGASVAAQVSRVAHPHEAAKYRLHVEEVGKITSLLLALSGRLARAENALMGLPMNHAERKILESKRDKLREQLEEAKKLKENIDRRSISVSNILYKYFNSEEYADYDHFINMKAKLIMDSREIADKIKLGEEQLTALRETLHTPSD